MQGQKVLARALQLQQLLLLRMQLALSRKKMLSQWCTWQAGQRSRQMHSWQHSRRWVLGRRNVTC